jgi:putative heme iron utilization protein
MQTGLSSETAEQIRRHMNDDHADAVAGYARTFTAIADVTAAEIIELDAHGMRLAVTTKSGCETAHVPFDHALTGTDDARATLIAMAQLAQSG